MRTGAWVTAALAVALTAACKDRDRRHDDTISADRAEQTTGQVREGADRTEDATADAADKVSDFSATAVSSSESPRLCS